MVETYLNHVPKTEKGKWYAIRPLAPEFEISSNFKKYTLEQSNYL
jgi:hypothetical protein